MKLVRNFLLIPQEEYERLKGTEPGHPYPETTLEKDKSRDGYEQQQQQQQQDQKRGRLEFPDDDSMSKPDGVAGADISHRVDTSLETQSDDSAPQVKSKKKVGRRGGKFHVKFRDWIDVKEARRSYFKPSAKKKTRKINQK